MAIPEAVLLRLACWPVSGASLPMSVRVGACQLCWRVPARAGAFRSMLARAGLVLARAGLALARAGLALARAVGSCRFVLERAGACRFR